MSLRRIRTKNICVFSIINGNESVNNCRIFRELVDRLDYSLIFTNKIFDLNTNRCKVLLIRSDENFKLLPSEVKLIIDYLVGGGTLIILFDSLLECELQSNVVELTDILGIYPRCSTLTDSSKNNMIRVIYSDEFKSSIIDGISELYYPNGCSLIVKKRPFTKIFLRAKLSNKNAEPPIIVITRYGNGKAAIIGSRNFLTDDSLRIESNFRVTLSILSLILNIEFPEEKVNEFLEIIREKRERPKKEVMKALPTKIELPKTKEVMESKKKIISPISTEVVLPESKEVIERPQILKKETKERISEITTTEQLMNRMNQLEELVTRLVTDLTNLKKLIKSIDSKIDEIHIKLNDHDKNITKDIKKIHNFFKKSDNDEESTI